MKVGDTVWLQVSGNLARNNKVKIIETTIKSLGKKYITVDYRDVKFYVENKRQVTDYRANYIFWNNMQELYESEERAELLSEIKSTFSTFGNPNLTTSQLRTIHSIITTKQ